MAITSRIRNDKNSLSLFMHHETKLIERNIKRKDKRKTTFCMSMLLLVKEYFRI